MKKLEFILRRKDPFENTGGYDNEDINTLGAKKAFEGVNPEIKIDENGKISFVGGEKKLFSYDVVETLGGYCYVREVTISPGTYHEKWREPTEHEMESFIDLLKNVCQMEKINIEEDVIYKWYISKKRDEKINTVLK